MDRLMEDARWRKLDVIVVGRMDRAFRLVLHAAQTLEQLKHAQKPSRSVGRYDFPDG